MSDYQYYEFCKIQAPLTVEARKEMYSLSSRAKVSTHGATYVYNYGDFRGKPKELLLKHFDVFFYISNGGCIRLMFKYATQKVDADKLKKYCVKNVINCEIQSDYVLLDIDFKNENGFGWIEGEGMLPDLLPIYDEIKSGNYQFLQLVADASREKTDDFSKKTLTQAQEAFFRYAEID